MPWKTLGESQLHTPPLADSPVHTPLLGTAKLMVPSPSIPKEKPRSRGGGRGHVQGPDRSQSQTGVFMRVPRRLNKNLSIQACTLAFPADHASNPGPEARHSQRGHCKGRAVQTAHSDPASAWFHWPRVPGLWDLPLWPGNLTSAAKSHIRIHGSHSDRAHLQFPRVSHSPTPLPPPPDLGTTGLLLRAAWTFAWVYAQGTQGKGPLVALQEIREGRPHALGNSNISTPPSSPRCLGAFIRASPHPPHELSNAAPTPPPRLLGVQGPAPPGPHQLCSCQEAPQVRSRSEETSVGEEAAPPQADRFQPPRSTTPGLPAPWFPSASCSSLPLRALVPALNNSVTPADALLLPGVVPDLHGATECPRAHSTAEGPEAWRADPTRSSPGWQVQQSHRAPWHVPRAPLLLAAQVAGVCHGDTTGAQW